MYKFWKVIEKFLGFSKREKLDENIEEEQKSNKLINFDNDPDLNKAEEQVVSNTTIPLTLSDPFEFYRKGARLATGGTGGIYRCFSLKTDEEFRMQTMYMKQSAEVEGKFNGRHENVTAIIELFYYENHYYVIIERMDSDLSCYCRSDYVWDEKNVRFVIREVLKALAYIHSMDMIHRDIKSDNILVDSTGMVKLADFGSEEKVLSKTSNEKRSIVGTPCWMPPEVIKADYYDTSADIWSLGIVLFEMLEGEPPLFSLEPLKALLEITIRPEPEFKNKDNWSSDMSKLKKMFLQKVPTERISATEALDCDIFAEKKVADKEEFGYFIKHKFE